LVTNGQLLAIGKHFTRNVEQNCSDHLFACNNNLLCEQLRNRSGLEKANYLVSSVSKIFLPLKCLQKYCKILFLYLQDLAEKQSIKVSELNQQFKIHHFSSLKVLAEVLQNTFSVAARFSRETEYKGIRVESAI